MKHVSFSHVVTVHRLDDLNEDRRSTWLLDRLRFKRCIRQTSTVVNPVLQQQQQQQTVHQLSKLCINTSATTRYSSVHHEQAREAVPSGTA